MSESNIKMDPNVKQQWLDALRSKKYRRGSSYLCHSTGNGRAFCCLGVLTDLYLKQHGGNWKHDHEGKFYLPYDKDGEYLGDLEVLPVKVRDWAGLPSNNPDVYVSSYREQGYSSDKIPLAELNDTVAYGFSEIARSIERTF